MLINLSAAQILSLLVVVFSANRESMVNPQQIVPNALVEQSVDVSRRDWDEADQYDYFQREQKEDGSRTYEILMVQGSRHSRLVAINDKPLTQEQTRWEQQRLDKEAARRTNEVPNERQKRIEQYRKEMDRNRLLLRELTQALEFRFVATQNLSGRDAHVFDGIPRSSYKPPNSQAKALTGMRGRLWIDTATLHWVKAEAEVFKPVWIQSFAQVRPGTHFLLEQTPTESGAWMPSRFLMEVRAKVLFVFSHSQRQDFTYFGYHKRSVEAKPETVEPGPSATRATRVHRASCCN